MANPALATPQADQAATEGDVITLDVGANFTDADVTDSLVYSATGFPAGSALAIDPDTGLIFGTPNAADIAAAPYVVTVTCQDESSNSNNYALTIDIPAARSISAHLTFESGVIEANGNIEDGLYTDGFFIQTLVPDTVARTITNVTKSANPVASYNGALLVEGQGVTFGDDGGYPEMRGRLFRVRNPTGSQFDVYQDGDDTGYNPTKTTEGNTRTDTSAYGTWGGDCDAQGWVSLNTSQGNPTLPTDADVRVVSGPFTPPSNDIGAADPINPRTGSKLLSTEVHRFKANDVITGNSNKNKPRVSMALGNGQEINAGEEYWAGGSFCLPSNYDHETTTGVISRNQLFFLDDDPNVVGNNPFELHLRGSGGTFDNWVLLHDDSETVLKSVEDDVGLWVDVIVRIKCHQTAGILEIWLPTGPYTTSSERAMQKVFSQLTGAVGPAAATSFKWNLRQYKGSWNNDANTISSRVFWVGMDDFRFGRAADGCGYSDVHPSGKAEPA